MIVVDSDNINATRVCRLSAICRSIKNNSSVLTRVSRYCISKGHRVARTVELKSEDHCPVSLLPQPASRHMFFLGLCVTHPMSSVKFTHMRRLLAANARTNGSESVANGSLHFEMTRTSLLYPSISYHPAL